MSGRGYVLSALLSRVLLSMLDITIWFLLAVAKHLQMPCLLAQHPLRLRSQAGGELLVDFGLLDQLGVSRIDLARTSLGDAVLGASRFRACRRLLDQSLGHCG